MSINELDYKVQLVLERGAPLLNELAIKKLYTQEEISQIVKQRRQNEYIIRSAERNNLDSFLRYLEAEINFAQLIKVRERAAFLGINFGEEVNRTKPSDENLGSKKLKNFMLQLKHIKGIFDRAVFKFKSDITLWKSFAEFALRYNFSVEEVLEKACYYNPLEHKFWIFYAKYLFEGRNQIITARNVLRRGLQLNKKNSELWNSFFNLECMISVMTQEEKLLQESTDSSMRKVSTDLRDEEEEDLEEEDQEPEMEEDLLKESLHRRSLKMKTVQDLGDASTEQIYEIPITIYEKLLKNDASQDYELRLKLLQTLSKFPKSESLQNRMLKELIQDFPNNRQVIQYCFTFSLKNLPQDCSEDKKFEIQTQCAQNILNYLHFFNDNQIRIALIDLLLDFIAYWETSQDEKHIQRESDFIKLLIEKAYENVNLWDCNLVLHCMKVLLRLGKSKAAIDLFLTCESKSNEMYLDYIDLIRFVYGDVKLVEKAIQEALKNYTQLSNQSKVNESHKFYVFESKESKSEKKVKFWSSILEKASHCFVDSSLNSFMEQLFQTAIRENVAYTEFKLQYVNWVFMSKGSQYLQSCIDYILRMPPNSQLVFNSLIRLVKKYFENESQLQDNLLQNLFSKSELEFGKSESSFWIQHIKWCQEKKQFTKAQNLYTEAVKTLIQADQFILQYNQLK